MSVSSNNNIISVKGKFYEFPRFCSALHEVIDKKRWSEVILDFSRCETVSEQVMLPLMPLIVQYRKEKEIDFKLHESANEPLRRLFINANWGHYINPKEYDYKAVLREGAYVPASQYEDWSFQQELHENVMNLVLGNLQVTRDSLKVVEWSLWEIMDNVSNHAESPCGGFVQATAFQNLSRVEFVVADAGMGIPVSMNEPDHEKAIEDAISEGVTKDKQNNAGNGLYGSYQSAVMSGGEFEIHSLNGHFFRRSGQQAKLHRGSVPYKGTSVRCAIGVSDPELLSKALRFKGVPSDPYSLYLEKFENEDEEVIFHMKTEVGNAFGSRNGGKHARTKIENLLRGKKRIILDFDGVGIISSSFADEVFGRLFVDMGFRAFARRIEMRNVDPTIDGLIDRAIAQRSKLGNGSS
ncbi:MAG: DUF4325 domain-containing protein [Hyphomicrobiales bacterium]|nr:DUF4325 domain-containing protein [Hyphomicrobiales bacterium]